MDRSAKLKMIQVGLLQGKKTSDSNVNKLATIDKKYDSEKDSKPEKNN